MRAFRRFKDHRALLHYSPLLKKTCVRQVVLDKWFPLILAHASVDPRRRRAGGGEGDTFREDGDRVGRKPRWQIYAHGLHGYVTYVDARARIDSLGGSVSSRRCSSSSLTLAVASLARRGRSCFFGCGFCLGLCDLFRLFIVCYLFVIYMLRYVLCSLLSLYCS